MPLELPNLDDRTYDDLVKEALSMIPTYAPDWTNYNPSDPGITLIELFAYLSEMLIYRLNRVTDENILTFLTLLNGPGWVPTQDLREEVRKSVLHLRSRYRAVTREDYERLSTENFNRWLGRMQEAERSGNATGLEEWWTVTGLERTQDSNLPSRLKPIQRAHCVAERNLELTLESDRRKHAEGHVSLVILPANPTVPAGALGPQPSENPPQAQILRSYLDERRLLTTRLHVVGPTYTPVSAEILVARYPDVLDRDLRRQMIGVINDFLSPLPVATLPNYPGWTFGRDVYVSELYELLEKLEGIDYLPDILLSSQCPEQDFQCVAAESMWNQEGDQIGLKLYEHHLPAARILPEQIVIVPNTKFRVVALQIKVTPVPGTDIPDLKQRIKAAVRSLLQSLRQQPNPSNKNPTRLNVLNNQNAAIAFRLTRLERISQSSLQFLERDFEDKNSGPIQGVQTIRISDFEADGIRVEPDEVIDLRLHIQIEGG
jgi:hypothetical protein